jgi:hypothetical protein
MRETLRQLEKRLKCEEGERVKLKASLFERAAELHKIKEERRKSVGGDFLERSFSNYWTTYILEVLADNKEGYAIDKLPHPYGETVLKVVKVLRKAAKKISKLE